MPLATGARLGPYRIDAEIGAGGMGHVFRATDTRLDRAVAIKILPQHRWSDPQLRLRFEREARALSSLSHPNLCALYDVGEIAQSGAPVPYLVMELLEGDTLRERLAAGRLSMRKALSWAAQIASGLAAAHQKGVIHRDLKPDNIFVTRGESSDELLKILDFGLALTEPGPTDTSTLLRTEPGMVMGTAQYMSPEQVRGEHLDARSDIFSLGIVLFEMLTGRAPFQARSAVETMSAILTEEPPELTSLVPAVPESVETLVGRCLEKDPAQRFSSARDLAFALESAARSATPSAPRSVTHVSRTGERRTPRMLPRILLLALLAAGIITFAVLSRDTSPPDPPRMRMLTYSGRDSAPAASPDGRLIAYVSSRDGVNRIWLKQLSDGTEAPITSGPDDEAPRFSPDGAQLLFTRSANGKSSLYRVAVVGGEPRKLLDNAFEGDFSPDGKRVAFIRNRDTAGRFSTVCVASVEGGAVRELAASTAEDFNTPRWSPSADWIAVTRGPHNTSAGAILLLDPESETRRVLMRTTPHGALSAPAWTPDGRAVLYAELEALAGSSLPRRRGSSSIVLHQIDGRARVLLRNPHSAADTVDVVGNDRLVFTEDVTRQSLQEVALDGRTAPRWLSRGMSVDRQPAYARGGASVVFTSDRGGNVDLWEVAVSSGRVQRLTDHDAIDWDPHPAPDDTSLFWSSDRGGHFEIWTAALDGANPQQVTRDGVDAENPSLPANGEWIYYDSSNPKSDGVWRVPRGGGPAQLVVAGETLHPAVSADGQYVAFQRPDSGRGSTIVVVRATGGEVFSTQSSLGTTSVRAHWIGTTHTLAFRAADAGGRITLFAQDVVPMTDTIATRRQLIPADPDSAAESFAISPDGQRAVLSIIDEASGLMIAEGVDWK
ncbi:MAG: protein kinase [Acidobacteriota bacterium]